MHGSALRNLFHLYIRRHASPSRLPAKWHQQAPASNKNKINIYLKCYLGVPTISFFDAVLFDPRVWYEDVNPWWEVGSANLCQVTLFLLILRTDRWWNGKNEGCSLFCILTSFFACDFFDFIVSEILYFTLTLFLLMPRADRGERQEGREKAS